MFGRASVRSISPRELGSLIASGAPPFLLDVRNPHELRSGGVVPGVVNVPLVELEGRLGELPADRGRPIIVICQSGMRSMSAARLLVKAGYGEVYNLDGGTSAWMRVHGAKA